MTDTIKPAAWLGGDGHPRHISAVQSATDLRLYGRWNPLFTQAAIDAAVAAERERLAQMLERTGNDHCAAAIRARAALGEKP